MNNQDKCTAIEEKNARIAELERKLAEREARIKSARGLLQKVIDMANKSELIINTHVVNLGGGCYTGWCDISAWLGTADMGEELNNLLTKAKEEGFAEGSLNAGFAHALDYNESFNKGKEEGRREAVPEGWQVVPKKPTEEMLIVGYTKTAWCVMAYTEMLAAALKPK